MPSVSGGTPVLHGNGKQPTALHSMTNLASLLFLFWSCACRMLILLPLSAPTLLVKPVTDICLHISPQISPTTNGGLLNNIYILTTSPWGMFPSHTASCLAEVSGLLRSLQASRQLVWCGGNTTSVLLLLFLHSTLWTHSTSTDAGISVTEPVATQCHAHCVNRVTYCGWLSGNICRTCCCWQKHGNIRTRGNYLQLRYVKGSCKQVKRAVYAPDLLNWYWLVCKLHSCEVGCMRDEWLCSFNVKCLFVTVNS